jgi:hypothetical protein
MIPHIGQRIKIGGRLYIVRALDQPGGVDALQANVESVDGFLTWVDVRDFDDESPSYRKPTPREPARACATCGQPSLEGGTTCNACWEFESRLDGYLQRGGAKAIAAITQALRKNGWLRPRTVEKKT